MDLRLSTVALLLAAHLTLAGCETETSASPESDAQIVADLGGLAQDAGGDAQVESSDAATADCVPGETEFTETVQPILEARCGQCHGETLQYGAVHELVSYSDLMKPLEEGTVADLVASVVSRGLMPPAGQPMMGSEDRQALVSWATCDQDVGPDMPGPNPGGGFDSNRPILMDSEASLEGTDYFDFRADEFHVKPRYRDRYECFYFEAPVDEERFIRRIEVLEDDRRVLHHITLLPDAEGEPGGHGRCDDDNPLSLVYGWAPGQGALHFESGGMRIRPGQRYTLQIHYNNAAGHEDVRDSSGVRIHHGPVEGPEVSMLTFGPLGFNIPANSTKTVDGWCRLPSDTTILYSFPHMHGTGSGFDAALLAGGEREEDTSIVRLDGWDFDSQYIYQTPTPLKAGDVVRTSCTFTNNTDDNVRFGPDTADEMCFNFAYVSPPAPVSFCNQNDPPIDYEYVPGECASPGVETLDVPAVFTPFIEGEVPVLEGGPPPEGTWVLQQSKLYLTSFSLGGFELDIEQSRVTALGTVALLDGIFYFDATTEIHVVAQGVAFDSVQLFSFNGPATFNEADPGALEVDVACGELPSAEGIRYGYVDGKLQVTAAVQFGPVALELLLQYEQAEGL